MSIIARAMSAFRGDAWYNAASGAGGSADKASYASYLPDVPLHWATLSNLYYGDDIAARIVDSYPKEAMRKGYQLKADDAELAAELQKWAEERFDVANTVVRGCKWGRLFGGALLIIGADDGNDLNLPLNVNGVKSVTWMRLEDRRYIVPESFYTTLDVNFGKPATYRLTFQTLHTSEALFAHASRCVRFGAVEVDPIKARTLYGWDMPSLQRPYAAMRQFSTAYASAESLLHDASQPVIKVKGLIDQLMGPQGIIVLQSRFTTMQLGRSILRALVLDNDNESFEKVQNNFAGIPDMMDRFQQRLSAACDIPVAILMGRSSAGLNATGDLDVGSWHAKLQDYRTSVLAPLLLQIYRILCLDKSGPTKGKVPEGLCIHFEPLAVPTAKEDADAYSVRATADCLYIDKGVLDPAQVALARFPDGEYSTAAPIVDAERLHAELDAKATFAMPEDPAATPVPAPPAPPVDKGAGGAA